MPSSAECPKDRISVTLDLPTAALSGDIADVRMLLDAGADVHARDADALRLAAYYGHAEVVRMLLDAGARWDRIPPDDLRHLADLGAQRKDTWLLGLLRAMIPEG